MDAAERLFGGYGFGATSLRAITMAAGVNVAAIHYHFHSKEGLVQAVCARRLGPINQRRLQMLDQCQARHGPGQLPLEEVVQAFLAPLLELTPDSSFRQLMARMYTEPGDRLPPIVLEQMSQVARRFSNAFQQCLPDRRDTDIYWGAFFTIGMTVHAMHAAWLLHAVSAGRCNPGETEELAKRTVAFACAGLRSLPAVDPG